ncbi:hypothetical protein Q3G72_008683 [Acer saccharum]|nr:hypothetical protein Q3G72_008683 [Acer saccharum]
MQWRNMNLQNLKPEATNGYYVHAHRKLVLYPNGNKSKNVKDHISLYLTLADTSSLPLGWEVYAVLRLFLLDQRKDIQDDIEKESHFHELKLECGFDHFVSLKAFHDASNGYLVEDRKIKLYPKGLTSPKGSHLSFYLYSVDLTPGSKVYTDFTFRILDQLHANHITFKADQCFINSTSGWGSRKFVSLSHLNDPVNGCLVKDVCVVEAEVNVWGCQSSTADIVK